MLRLHCCYINTPAARFPRSSSRLRSAPPSRHPASDTRSNADLFFCFFLLQISGCQSQQRWRKQGRAPRWRAPVRPAKAGRGATFQDFKSHVTHELMCLFTSDRFLTFSSSSHADSERNGPESNHQVGLLNSALPSLEDQTRLLR